MTDIALQPPTPPKPEKINSIMWETFEHCLMFISLYFSAGGLAIMLHQFIDTWIPHLQNRSSASVPLYLFAFAMLLAALPFFIYFHKDLNKRMLTNPAIKDMQTRKLLIYFTLVITFIILVSAMISLVFAFLNLEFSLNIFLHFVVTVGISGTIFWYYFSQIKEEQKPQ